LQNEQKWLLLGPIVTAVVVGEMLLYCGCLHCTGSILCVYVPTDPENAF